MMRRNVILPARLLTIVLGLVGVASGVAVGFADGPYELRRASRDGIGKFYLGREIAYVMGYQGAGWLERPR